MVKTQTDFCVLMRLAATLGKTKKSGNQTAINKAQKEHDAYHKLCRAADNMSLGVSVGYLS